MRNHLKILAAAALAALLSGAIVAWAAQTNYLGTVFIADTTTPTQQLKVNADGSLNVNTTATPVGAVGITPVTTASAVEANHVIKASAGNLYSLEVSADSTLSAAAWWIMVYNATSAPGDGAVTPLKCYALPPGTTSLAAAFPTPVAFSTGITIGVSTTGCFTKTASAHAFISGDAQ